MSTIWSRWSLRPSLCFLGQLERRRGFTQASLIVICASRFDGQKVQNRRTTMILSFYKLREQPFGVTPDSRYLYLSPTHREALASVLYGLSADRGFTALIAKPGMGKTTLLFDVLSKVKGRAKTVFLFQLQSSPAGCGADPVERIATETGTPSSPCL